MSEAVGMFSALFDEQEPQYEARESGGSGVSLPKPAAPRNSTNLCGLSNLGATCYLNSLLQTLHFTPEFREALFTLGEDELGVYSEGVGTDNSMVRVIPIQLQKLFVRLLLLNQQSAEVDSLTTSFGWKNNEELQQHDVQELNRILFAAIESSLLGTAGEQLIARLYHGTSVQQVTCQQCGRVSEREEEFLDLPVALSERSGLERALEGMFLQPELLEGANQYRCESCQVLVNAKRGCHLRKLPPILTFALLRFLYDFQKGERYKDTSRFRFPLELDMAPYCEPHPPEDAPGQPHTPGAMHYELFSVVVHSGSTHSGHYTAYIRDIDDLGVWTHPDREPIQMQADPSSGNVDFIDYDSPTELLQELLRQLGGTTPIDKLCKAMSDKTGVSWNKRFKKQFGPINKFLKSCTEFFVVNEVNQVSLKDDSSCEKEVQEPKTIDSDASATLPATAGSTADTGEEVVAPRDISDEGAASLEQPPSSESEGAGSSTCLDLSELPGGGAVTDESSCDAGVVSEPGVVVSESDLKLVPEEKKVASNAPGAQSSSETTDDLADDSTAMESPDGPGGSRAQAKKRNKDSSPPPGHCWFEFNDTHVGPVVVKSIEKMWQGKASAYMLFYRKKTLQRPKEARENLLYCVPERLQMEVAAANATLEEERIQYDIAMNTVKLDVHLSVEYAFANGALQRIEDSPPAVVSIDRRNTIVELKVAIIEMIPELAGESIVLHTAKHLPSGLHLYNCVSGDDCSTIADAGITNDSHLFLWDGEEVGREVIQVGASCEPILLNVTYPTAEDGEIEMVSGFHKNSTLGELRVILADLQGCRPQQVTISQVKISETRAGQSQVVVLSGSKDKLTLEELHLSDGDRLAAEREVKKGVKTLAHSVADKQSKMISFIVEDRCSLLSEEQSESSLFPVEVSKEELLSTVKVLILSRIGIVEVEGGGRLRLEDDTTGVGPPLHENQTMTQAGITSGQTVIVEPGQAPLSSQLALRCALQPLRADSVTYEVILERSTTVEECLAVMVVTAELQGDQWHLRRTNWCREAVEVLEDEMATLEQEWLKPGDLLLIEEGKLPPKGFIRLPIFLYTPTTPFLDTLTATPPDHSSERAGALAWITDSIKTLMGSPRQEGDSKTQEPNCQPTEESGVDAMVIEERELPSSLYPPLPGELSELGSVEVNKDATTEHLKTLIATLPALENAFLPTFAFLRVRELVNGRPGKILKQPQQTLRRQKLTSASQVCCTVLPHEDNLPASALVFNICMRIPGERRFGPLTEVIYDTAPSTSPHALLNHISELLGLPPTRLAMAKHKVESFQWIRIQDSYQETGKRKKKGKVGAINIKNSPIMLRDGDTVGVKDLQYDPDDQDDFSTPQDDKGREILAAIQEEKRRMRKAKGREDVFSRNQHQGRAEAGIKIFVPDYQAKLNSKQQK